MVLLTTEFERWPCAQSINHAVSLCWQVMAAPPEKREELLADLQKFAFMGIPDIRQTQNGQVGRCSVKARASRAPGRHSMDR